jgi:hypothetical protein
MFRTKSGSNSPAPIIIRTIDALRDVVYDILLARRFTCPLVYLPVGLLVVPVLPVPVRGAEVPPVFVPVPVEDVREVDDTDL